MKKQLTLTKDVFFLSKNGYYIVFAPLKNIVARINDQAIIQLQIFDQTGEMPDQKLLQEFKDLGIIEYAEQATQIPKQRHQSSNFKPTSVTIFPSNDCQLRCIYCYGSAGEETIYLNPDIAKASVDLVFKNAIELKKRKVSIGFHGAGEVFFGRSWDLVKTVVEYAINKGLELNIKPSFTAATNGILSTNQIKWISENFRHLTISLDGPEEIHDQQRPTANGLGSYKIARRTIDYLEKINFSYSLRATITASSCAKMTEIISHFMEISNLKSFHIEPLYVCGRCLTTGAQPPDPEEFANNFLAAQKVAKNNGREIYYSGANLDRVSNSFCGASGRNFSITPDGLVTSCYEVNRGNDFRASEFIFGHFDATNHAFVFYPNVLEKLRQRTIENLPNCQECFLKFNCGGDCPAKSGVPFDMFKTNNSHRCGINRTLASELLDQLSTPTEAMS